jgi:hypothetical protein
MADSIDKLQRENQPPINPVPIVDAPPLRIPYDPIMDFKPIQTPEFYRNMIKSLKEEA